LNKKEVAWAESLERRIEILENAFLEIANAGQDFEATGNQIINALEKAGMKGVKKKKEQQTEFYKPKVGEYFPSMAQKKQNLTEKIAEILGTAAVFILIIGLFLQWIVIILGVFVILNTFCFPQGIINVFKYGITLFLGSVVLLVVAGLIQTLPELLRGLSANK